MESISQVFAWIGANENVLSGLAATIVIVGVLLSPLRRRFGKSAASEKSVTSEAPQPAASLIPVTDRPSIAVLPFTNLSGDAEHQYLADGLTEDIITGLSRVKQFFVIARNTTFTYKDRAVDVQQVRGIWAFATCSKAAFARRAIEFTSRPNWSTRRPAHTPGRNASTDRSSTSWQWTTR